MDSGMGGDAPGVAEVVVLAVARAARGDLSGLAADCPGWTPTYSARGGTWIARRASGVWRQAEGDDSRRTYLVIAQDPQMLLDVINSQALLDLAVEFPAWDVTRGRGSRWWATYLGDDPDGGPVGVCDLSPVRLVAALRLHATGAGDPAAPGVMAWGEPR